MDEARVLPDQRLLRALAEQLKLPLLQIALAAEAGDKKALRQIGLTASMAIELVDSFLLSTEVQSQTALELEPVSMSAVLQSVADKLQDVARQHQYDIEVKLNGRYAPVMAHAKSLESAMMLLGHSILEAVPVRSKHHTLVLGAHKTGKGIVAGAYADQPHLTTDAYRRARALFGTVRQPLPSLSSASGAGIFVADALFSSMATPLHVAHHDHMTGLASTFVESGQTQLV